MPAVSRYSAQVFLLATLFAALPAAAQQQIYNVTINLGTGNGTVTYQEVVTQVTCVADAKYTYHYTRINDGSFVYHPVSASQISIAGTFTLINGSPGAIPKSNCPANRIIGVPIRLLRQNYQIYVYGQTNGLNGMAAAYVPGTFGYINPKYVVADVLYAPPGSKSSAVYTSSTTVSNTTSLTNTFTSSTTVTDSTTTLAGAPNPDPSKVFMWLNGSIMSTYSTTETQQSQNSASQTLSRTTTNGLSVPGPQSDYIGLDHDYDIIEVWINPVLLFTVYNTGIAGETQIVWWGYGSSGLDTTAPIDIWPIQVGCLNGDFPQTDSACATPLNKFQRPWAANENWPSGQGPGLTQSDLNNILAADPWGKCTPNDPIGSTACPTYSAGFLLTNFSLSDQTQVPYTQPLPGGQPGAYSHGVSTTNSQTQGSTTTVTYSQTWGYEIDQSGSGFLSAFSSKLSFAQTLTWSYAYSTSLTVSGTKSGTANVTSPACVGNPCNPSYPPAAPTFGNATAFDIFIDSRFGTFAFLPSAY